MGYERWRAKAMEGLEGTDKEIMDVTSEGSMQCDPW